MVFETPLRRKSMNTRAIAKIKYLFKKPVIIIAKIAQTIETEESIKTAKSCERPW